MTRTVLSKAARRGVAGSAVLLVALSTGAPALAQESPSPSPSPSESAAPEPAPVDAGPQNPNRYSLSASADGMSYLIQNGKLPANITVEFSPVSSAAKVNSAGASEAFAGLPYAGAIAQTLPGTVNGLTGGATPPIPPIPGFVATRFPGEPDNKQAQGPYLITAESKEVFSKATAVAGSSPDADAPEGQLSSRAEVVAKPDGSVVALGKATAQGLKVGPLKILEFSVSEKITEIGDGKPVFESSTNLGTLQVAGFLIGVTDKGFNIAGSTVPIPAADALKAVNEILGAQATKINYIPRSVTKNNVTGATTVSSGALQITTVQDVPVQGPTTVVYTYGKVVVSSVNVASADSPVGVDVPVVDLPVGEVPTGGSDVAAPPAFESGTDAPLLDSGLGTTPDVDLAPAPDVDSGGVVAAPQGPTVAAPLTPTQLGFLPSSAPRGDGALIYLVLVLGGAAVVVGQQVFSRFGIQLLLRA